MSDFIRFPQTPHIAWLGDTDPPRDDKMLSHEDAKEMLLRPITIEEKIDGANVGFSIDESGDLRVQNRGKFLYEDHCHAQFKPLFRWLEPRKDLIAEAIFPDLMLFGEWCYATHSVSYQNLPEWFLAFDVYDRKTGEFWSVEKRNALVESLGLCLVPCLGRGTFDLETLKDLMKASKVTDGPAEGVYLRLDEEGRLVKRAKLVRAGFVQAIEEHWSRKSLQVNRVVR